MVYAPLGGGWLTGKYRRGEAPPEGSRATGVFGATGRWDEARPEVQRKYELAAELQALAAEAGLSLVQLAMAFAVEHPAVSSAILGPRTLPQAQDCLSGVVGAPLDPGILDRIDALVAPGAAVDPRETRNPNPALDDASQRRRRH